MTGSPSDRTRRCSRPGAAPHRMATAGRPPRSRSLASPPGTGPPVGHAARRTWGQRVLASSSTRHPRTRPGRARPRSAAPWPTSVGLAGWLCLGYLEWALDLWGRAIGKRILGIRMVSEDNGQTVTWGRRACATWARRLLHILDAHAATCGRRRRLFGLCRHPAASPTRSSRPRSSRPDPGSGGHARRAAPQRRRQQLPRRRGRPPAVTASPTCHGHGPDGGQPVLPPTRPRGQPGEHQQAGAGDGSRRGLPAPRRAHPSCGGPVAARRRVRTPASSPGRDAGPARSSAGPARGRAAAAARRAAAGRAAAPSRRPRTARGRSRPRP